MTQPLIKKADGRLFCGAEFAVFACKTGKIAAFSRKAKTTGVSNKCIFAFDSPPFAVLNASSDTPSGISQSSF